MFDALKDHWPEYCIEAGCLGAFMVSACFFGVLMFHHDSPLASLSMSTRNVMMGIAMGSTAVAIICSPFGKRSGAHFNPAVTLTFLRLGKIQPIDALFYTVSQFTGGIIGVLISYLLLGGLLADSSVNFVTTVPGVYGTGAAFAAELVISFVMMTIVLFTSNSKSLAQLTPLFAGSLVAVYISVESPISGMSMNPARTVASAFFSGNWMGSWIYFLAPPLAMLAASEFFVRVRGLKSVLCAKLNHFGASRCIFNCEFGKLVNRRDAETQRTVTETVGVA